MPSRRKSKLSPVGGVRAGHLVISTVWYMAEVPKQVDSRGWRLSAVLVGVLAVFVAGWATDAFDINGGRFYVVWLAIAIGFIGIATLLLVPRARSQSRRRPSVGADRP